MSSKRWRGWVEAAALATLAGPALGAPQADVFRLDKRRPYTAVVTTGVVPPDTVPETSMGRQVAGVLAQYGTKDISVLLRCVTDEALTPQMAKDAGWAALIHLSFRGRDDVKVVVVLRLADGRFAAEPLGSGGGVVLDRGRFEKLLTKWPAYRGVFDSETRSRRAGKRFVLERPYAPGLVKLTTQSMKRRIYRGMPVRLDNPARELAKETFHCRLPSGYDPRRPAGLLVWCSPTPRGAVPGVFDAVLDELNIVCVGADNAGNDRDVPTKFQLLFDALTNVRERYHIDRRRIYITGMSGGGKVSSILGVCFSEVFSGSIPIVGFSSYTQLDESWDRYRVPYYTKPRGDLLALALRSRIALMGGPPDFNYKEMVERSGQMKADGFTNIRFFDYPDMAHVMPTSPRFTDALQWVDEPYRDLRRVEEEAASTRLAAYLDGRDDPMPRTDEDRNELVQVIDVGPFTNAAWKTLNLLR